MPFEPDLVSTDVVFEGKVWDIRRDVVHAATIAQVTREYVDHTGRSRCSPWTSATGCC